MTNESGIYIRKGEEFLSSSHLPEQLFCREHRDRHEAHHTSTYSVVVKNARRYISSLTYVFIAWRFLIRPKNKNSFTLLKL
jgi:hypothetical protein